MVQSMRNELQEAIKRVHSDDYQRMVVTEKQLKKSRRKGGLRVATGSLIGMTFGAPAAKRIFISVVVVAALTTLFGAGIYYYNRFSLLVVDLGRDKSLVDNEIRRRADLIPNLLVVSAEYGAHEKTLQSFVTEMRTHSTNYSEKSGGGSIFGLGNPMSPLTAILEQYPDLKATQSFERLMEDWTETENRIAQARADYIATVRDYNGLCTTFPSNVFALAFGNKKYDDAFSFDESAVGLPDPDQFYSDYLSKERFASIFDASSAQGKPTASETTVLTATEPAGEILQRKPKGKTIPSELKKVTASMAP